MMNQQWNSSEVQFNFSENSIHLFLTQCLATFVYCFACLAADTARNEFQEADKTFHEVSRKLQELNDLLNLDLGDDER